MNSKDLSASKTYRGRLLRIAVRLIFAIAVLGVVQWATAFRGDLLWVVMAGLSIVLVWAILGTFRGSLQTTNRINEPRRSFNKDWLGELHCNDPHYLGSPYYRSHLDD